MRYIICVLMGFFLISCSGTGTKNFSAINSMMMSGKGQVFVGREKGYFNSAVVYDINLNGKHLGKLGNGETIVGDSIKGNNVLETPALFGGDRVSFVRKGKENNYFIISYETKITHGEVKLYEVTESSFRNRMQ
jgi:hypothetical protein